MSRQQRLTFAAIAAVIAVVAVIALSGGSGDEPETAATTSTPAETATPAPDTTAEATETPEAEPTPEPTPEAIEIEVEGGKVKGGEVDIDVEEGENVRFTVKSDAADHVHVHGYDVLKDLTPGKAARLSFKATIPGVFEIELEDSHLQIARLRVKQ
jgi:heme/copper-type cytochrome/quinol oxidase subunit 2